MRSSTILKIAVMAAAATSVSSCAGGAPGAVGDRTETSAILNGAIFSTVGGPTDYYFEYGKTAARGQRTETRTVDLPKSEGHQVSDEVTGLEPATTYHFSVCAGDSQNQGHPVCFGDKTFKTHGGLEITMTPYCASYPPTQGARATVTGLPPNVTFHATLTWPGGSVNGTAPADANGSASQVFGGEQAGEFSASVEYGGVTVTESLYVDCQYPQ